MIHPSAIIDPQAEIAADVEIGPYAVIGAEVQVGSGTRVGAHVVIDGPTIIGERNRVYSHAALGGDPQDKKYQGERSRLEIGNDNTIREFVTISRGTADGGGYTRLGNDNWVMAYVHIAHDCQIGSHTIFANGATLAGHVTIEDHVILAGFSMIHQFCRIGRHAFTGMGAAVNRDIPPYVMVAGRYAEPRGINAEGLKRRGYSVKRINAIKRAYKALYRSGLALDEAKSQLRAMADESADVAELLAFVEASTRGLLR